MRTKKTLITLGLSIILLSVSAQCKLSKDEIDDFTGDTIRTTKATTIGSFNGYYVKSSVARINQNYIASFICDADLGCVTSETYIIIKFMDGTTEKFFHLGDFECGDNSQMMISFEKDLIMKEVEKIRIQHTDYYLDVPVKNPNFFIERVNCIR